MSNRRDRFKKGNHSKMTGGFLGKLLEMKNWGEKKFLFLFFTLFFKTVINFFLLFYVAKVTSVSDFGSFSFSFVVMTIAILLIDYGYNLQALVLDFEEEKGSSERISAIVSGKIIMSIVLILLFAPIIAFSSFEVTSKQLILIFALAAFPNSFGNFLFALFKSKNEYKVETFGFLAQVIFLIVLLAGNHFFGSTDVITISYLVLITKGIYFIYAFYEFRRSFTIELGFSIKEGIKSLRNSFSYGTHLILGTLILYVETLFLSYFASMESVGYYQAGLRIVMASSLLGAIITDGFVPEISKKLYNRKFVVKRMVNLFSFLFVFYVLVLITLGFYFDTIIKILFSSEYGFVREYLVYILAIIFLRAMGIVPGVVLTSTGLQRIRAIAVAYSFVLSVVLNFFLIPRYGLEGAFISFMSTNVLLNGIYVFFAFKEINFAKIVLPNVVVVLLIYLLLHALLSVDNILFLVVTAFLNLIILLFVQRRIKKLNAYVPN